MIEKKRYNIGITTWPISQSGFIPLRNLVDILESLSSELYLITGGAGYTFLVKTKNLHIYEVEHRAGTNIFARAINYAWTQLRISYKLIVLSKKADFWFFFIGGEGLIIPMLAIKLLRKKIIIVSAGSGLKVARAKGDPFTGLIVFLQNITHYLSDRIIIYSTRLIKQYKLDKYRDKILIAHEHFLDFDKFKITEEIARRQNLIGYIGTLSKSKGVPSFLEAIPLILGKRRDIQFLLGGAGEMEDKLTDYIKESNLNGSVSFVGWIPHDELPKYLNRLKLLVLPSYTEGLPNIILEAMACGTPVLATAVGAIPDVIKDGETGFIMGNNSPECIAKNVIRALNHPNLEQITKNAHALMEQEFSYEKAVERYKSILNGVLNKH